MRMRDKTGSAHRLLSITAWIATASTAGCGPTQGVRAPDTTDAGPRRDAGQPRSDAAPTSAAPDAGASHGRTPPFKPRREAGTPPAPRTPVPERDAARADAGPDAAVSCEPLTCETAGAECGSVADGCGGTLECSGCPAPATCGGGGTANTCGCTPMGCAEQEAECGTLSDACGGDLDCGTCTAPAVCGARSPHRCAVPRPAMAGAVIVTEIMPNPDVAADAHAEWVEIHNPSPTDTYDLDGCVLSDRDGDMHTIDAEEPLLIAPEGYVVLGASADPSTNGGTPVDYAYRAFVLANGTDEVQLACDDVQIDAVAYDEATFPTSAGASMSLDPAALDADRNDDGATWCATGSEHVFGTGDAGTPGAPNAACVAA